MQSCAKKYWGELVPTEERFPLSADEVLSIDLDRIVTQHLDPEVADRFHSGTDRWSRIDRVSGCRALLSAG